MKCFTLAKTGHGSVAEMVGKVNVGAREALFCGLKQVMSPGRIRRDEDVANFRCAKHCQAFVCSISTAYFWT